MIERTSGNFRRQLKRLGFSYDWDREINTTDPKYYKWTQWIFYKMWDSWFDRETSKRRGRSRSCRSLPTSRHRAIWPVASYRDERRLAYIHEAPVNWCPALRVVLANEEVAEQVEKGLEVIRRPMKQWMLRITEYAERLLEDLDKMGWPPHVLEIQRNWIGRSEGGEIDFGIAGHEGASLRVFTTRPDTLYGATYMVLAPEHPLVDQITTDGQREGRDRLRPTHRASDRTRSSRRVDRGHQDRGRHRGQGDPSADRRTRSRSGSPTTC